MRTVVPTTGTDTPPPPPPPRRVNFSPAVNGFKFANSFTNDFIPALDIRTDGLCGGMSYAALDFYNAQKPIPTQPFRPANGTPLHSYLYDRQVTSLTSNLDKWAEIGFNPLGVRSTEFFNWGISAKPGERIDELRQFLDIGNPAMLGLQGEGSTGNHQIIAIGYDMGRYRGDLGAFTEDFKIFVCDPNYPGQVRTLVADAARQIYRYQEGGSETWRTYFVDKNYHPQPPPAIPNANYPADGKVYELILDCHTGDDDLRGGNDNLNLVVNLMDGTQQTFSNINFGSRWIVNNDESAEVVLHTPVKQEQIRSLELSATFTGGIGGDNWNLNTLIVYAFGGGFYREVTRGGFKRFTGEDKVLNIPINDVMAGPGQVNKLWFTFRTGSDDLRGVNDNVNITVHYRSGPAQTLANANHGQQWNNNSDHLIELDLNRAVKPEEIVQIDISTTFIGGIGGDNWNMDSVSVRATGNGVDQVLVTYGFKRFTGDDHFLAIPAAAAGAGQVNRLQLTFQTGDDDLRGGSDNLNVMIHCRDGRVQLVPNVNGGSHWGNGTTNFVTISLDHAVAPNDILGLDLQTTFGGGIGGDNWNMNHVTASAQGDGVNQVIFDYGFNRFTGSDKLLQLRR